MIFFIELHISLLMVQWEKKEVVYAFTDTGKFGKG
jgi:hypothetical protein